MIPVAICSSGIAAETFSPGIIIMIYAISCPFILALDTKMVIGLFHQIAVACLGLMDTLGQRNGGGYARTLHFTDSQLFVSIDVIDDVRVDLGVEPFACQDHDHDPPP